MTYAQLTIAGNVGNDPELKYTSSGVAVCDFSLAVNRRWTNASGERQEQATWFRVTCWRKTAEIAAQYVTKGRQVMVVASQIEADAYEGKDGKPRASLNVTCDQLVLLSDGNRNGGASTSDEDLPF